MTATDNGPKARQGQKSRLTAITGGIGSGKSVVSQILRMTGYDVYDCDSRARAIIDENYGLRRRIADAIGAAALNDDGTYNRAAVSAIVFASPDKLQTLNSLVHDAVKEDITQWAVKHGPAAPDGRLFVETAIPYQSGLHLMVDDIWEIHAPENLRIARVMSRNNMSAEQVCARIEAQKCRRPREVPPVHIILNDNQHHLTPQILALLEER